jgi:hypothetical protein
MFAQLCLTSQEKIKKKIYSRTPIQIQTHHYQGQPPALQIFQFLAWKNYAFSKKN